MRDFKTPFSVLALAAAILPAQAPAALALSIVGLDVFDQADLADGYLDAGDVATSEDGLLSMTVTSLAVSNGAEASSLDEDGIYFSREAGVDDVVTLTFVLSEAAWLIGYDIDWSDAEAGSFWISGPDGTTPPNDFWDDSLPGGVYWSFDMGDVPVFRAGVEYTLHHDLPALPMEGTDPPRWATVQIDELHWQVAPLPAPAALMAGALLGLGGLGALRRRIVRA